MFVGHFGLGLSGKKVAPSISLGTLFLGVQFLDLLWPTFLLLGIERVEINPPGTSQVPLDFVYYPWTHSLLMAIIWGVVVGGIYYVVRRNLRNTMILFFCVVSHWLLDLFVHHQDLPLIPGVNAFLGWKLWDYPGIELTLELAIFTVGFILYLRSTAPRDSIGKFAAWGLAIFLLAIHLANVLGPPPPSVTTIAWAGELQWLFVAMAYWVDRHRTPIAF